MDKAELKQQILALVEQYSALHFAAKPFQAGSSVVPPSGKVLGAAELKNMVEASNNNETDSAPPLLFHGEGDVGGEVILMDQTVVPSDVLV